MSIIDTHEVHHSSRLALVAVALLLVGTDDARAQFDSGSDGSDGALNVTASMTVTLPDDGILNYTTVTVADGATLTFARNGLNTPVYVLATGDILVSGGGIIDVSATDATATPSHLPGIPGPGGFIGGHAGLSGITAGDGHGPGGGKHSSGAGGDGAFGTRGSGGSLNGQTYGTPLLLGLIGGSGGAGANNVAGGSGGGALLLASNTRIQLAGAIRALGSDDSSGITCFCCCGSGGGVRLVAPRVEGSGSINVFGHATGQGDGRIRIDTRDRSSMNIDAVPDGAMTVGRFLTVFPSALGSLRIVSVAGTMVSAAATRCEPSEGARQAVFAVAGLGSRAIAFCQPLTCRAAP
ncbi:MAG: hypothetical protein AAF533_12780, partial [Acidobacteriota bacterium]